MSKPRILVLSAAGKTGLLTALQLLGEGFPVTAFVRQEDARSERLKAKGAKIVVGSMKDIHDMRKALSGAERAYFCAPTLEGYLTVTSMFVSVAAEQGLKNVVAMSQWLSSPVHPAIHTRQTWLSDRLLALIPGCDLTLLNPGYFADNDMQVLPMAAQLGVLMLPYGSGENAPPSNEDIGRVAAEILARPEGHAGKTYRITGPDLLSPEDIAAIIGKVVGRKVRYINAPLGILKRVMKQIGFDDYIIAQSLQYALEYQQGAFAVGGPTDVVRQITGQDAEDYETIVRRYAATMPDAKPGFTAKLRLMGMTNAAMLRPAPKTEAHLAKTDFSDQSHISLSANSAEWHGSHDHQDNAAKPLHPSLTNKQTANRQPLQSI